MMKRTLYLLALGIFGISTTEFGVIGILPQLAAHFKVSIEKAGWLLSAFALVIAVFGPFMALLFSGVNRKKAMLFVLCIFTLSNVISAMAPNFTVLLLARMLPAFLHPVFWSISLAAAAGTVPQAESPKAVGLVFGGFTIACVLGVPLETWVADLLGWQASFVLCAVVNGISFVGMLSLPDMPAGTRLSFGSQLQVLRKPTLWVQLLIACAMISAMYASYGYLAVYLGNVTKMNGVQISIMLLIFGIAGVGGNWLAGRSLSKSIPFTTLAFILLLAIVHVIAFYTGLYFVPMIFTIVLWGFVNTGGFLIGNVNVTAAAPESPEFVNSIFTSCGNLAVTIGSAAGGFAIAKAGAHHAIWVSVLLLAIALIVWPFSKRGLAGK